jgi:hypothetical protein
LAVLESYVCLARAYAIILVVSAVREAAVMFGSKMNRLDVWDLGLTKFAVAFTVLAVVGSSSSVRDWVRSQDSRLFALLALGAAARPLYRFFR